MLGQANAQNVSPVRTVEPYLHGVVKFPDKVRCITEIVKNNIVMDNMSLTL